MSILLLFIYLIILSFFLSQWKWVKRSGINKSVIIALFSIKALAGFALVLLYSTYYDKNTSDIFLYFNDAIHLKHLFLTQRDIFWNVIFGSNLAIPEVEKAIEPLMYWDSSSVDFLIHEKKIIILLNFLFSFITLDNIYIHSMFMAFIGFIGQLAIFRFVKRQSSIEPLYILIVTFLLPTFLLWTSTLLKEPLIIFSIGLAMLYIGKWTKQWQIKYFLSGILFLAIGLFIKPYVVIALSFPLFIFVLFKWRPSINLKKQSLIIFASSISILLLFWIISLSGFNVFEKLSEKQSAFYQVIQESEKSASVGSQIEINKLGPTISSFIYNSPKAFTNVMFKPSFYEIKKFLYLPDIFQNLLILIIGFSLVFRYKTPTKEEYPFLWLSLLFIIFLYTIIGLVTPVLGSIVRYKTPALIFVFYFLLNMVDLKFNLIKISSLLFNRQELS